MLEVVPKEIKKYFLTVSICGVLAFFLGLILSNKYIYVAYVIGVVFSLIINSYLLYSTYMVVYNEKRTGFMVTRYLISLILYAISIYLSNFLLKDKYAILVNALGLLSFRIVIYFYQIIKIFFRK